MGIIDRLTTKLSQFGTKDSNPYEAIEMQSLEPGRSSCNFEVRTNKERTAVIKSDLESHLKENNIKAEVMTGNFQLDTSFRYDDRITVKLEGGNVVTPELRDEIQGVITTSTQNFDHTKAKAAQAAVKETGISQTLRKGMDAPPSQPKGPETVRGPDRGR